MKKHILGAICLTMGLMSANAITVNYTADNNTIFRNPERGFTEEISAKISDSKNHLLVGEEDWFDESGDRETQTVAMVLYNLYNYKSKDLSAKMLQGFDDDMQVLRNKGFKCLLRFAYTEQESDKNDATLAWAQRHISQLKSHLIANADVIYAIEAGFVGVWGEWYYTNNYGNESQSMNANRRALLDTLMKSTPQDRFVLVRYPLIKTQFLGDENTLTATQAFSGTTRARMGHHNDAFLNAWGNDGTYGRDGDGPDDDPILRRYIADETLYVPNGGETNVEEDPLALTVSGKDTTLAELRRYHWSFCGSSYAEAVTNRWRTNGAYAEMERKLGYRYQLVSATLPDQTTVGGTATINLQIKNVGFAPLYNERKAYLVFKNSSNTYPIQLQSDPRRWLPNDVVTTINEQLALPSNMPAGTYQLYLHLPDKYTSLASDPRFAVRFANTGVWESTTGMNKLFITATIADGTVTFAADDSGQGGGDGGDDPTPGGGDDPTPPTPSGDAVQLPATLNKANVDAVSSDMTYYSTDYFDFGSTDSENTGRWAEWKVYMRYPGQYIISVVNGFPGDDNADGNTWQLQLLNGSNVVSTYLAENLWAETQYTYSAKWDLRSVAVGEYKLRVMNTAAWEQPKLQSVTLQYDGILPTALEETDFNAAQPAYDILGRPVDATYHGVVIQNGKRYIR